LAKRRDGGGKEGQEQMVEMKRAKRGKKTVAAIVGLVPRCADP